ncbi:MAG: ACT domain-containing protein [Candidatus Polarisedimenticolia bacterium]
MTHTLELLPGACAVARLGPGAEVPRWAGGGPFVSITRTGDELSIVCPEAAVPHDVTAQRGFRCLRVVGPLDFGVVGVLASLTGPLARAGISIFTVSTYDTDYLLLRESDLERAAATLTEAGHTVSR